MISPEQTLLHLTSQGAKVRALASNQVGKFINQTQQPLTNINKFGLLHYSIPKTLDMLKNDERTFRIQVQYERSDEPSVEFAVTLPLMDYYQVTADVPVQYSRNNVDRLHNNQAVFTEILQTSINWAIQKYRAPTLPATGARARANRLGCVVKTDEHGILTFYFGYRGNTETTQSGAVVVKANSGAPWPATRAEAANDIHGWLRVMPQATNRYTWIDTGGIPRADEFAKPAGTTDEEFRQTYAIKSITFLGLSRRLMNMMGAAHSSFSFDTVAEDTGVDPNSGVVNKGRTRTVERGRVCLVDYKMPSANAQTNDPGSSIIKCRMYTPPNLFPPSFLFLNLLAQGTRTRVLGHDAERGGWAVPCASNEFVSSFDNYPWTTGSELPGNPHADYDLYQVRNMPMLMNVAKPDKAKAIAKGGGGNSSVYFQSVGGNPASLFDPKVPFPDDKAFEGDANHPRYPNITVLSEDNFSLVINTDLRVAPNDLARQYKLGSQMIHYGDLNFIQAPAGAPPRKRFGNGLVSTAPTFTVSMITPMYIYTDVPNATVQTLDVQLLWGDTATNVTDTASEPCQFSLIASQ